MHLSTINRLKNEQARSPISSPHIDLTPHFDTVIGIKCI